MPNMLDDIIKKMEAPQGISKQAAAAQVPQAGATEMGSLQEALAKTASAAPVAPTAETDPVAGLMVKAAKLAGADHQANVAEANMLGAAIADGFLAKMASAENSAKVAQADLPPAQYAAPLAPWVPPAPTVDQEIEKVAGKLEHLDTASMQKLAADAGYQTVMEKAAEDYKIGHDAALQEVANVAYGEFVKGAAETDELLRRRAAQQ